MNTVRLILATMVIVSHSIPIGSFGTSLGDASGPLSGLGGWAVYGFFAASGFLIAGSRMRVTFWRFLWRRCLRIFPGYWVMLMLVAFCVAPLSTFVDAGASFSAAAAARYVSDSWLLFRPAYEIPGTLVTAPYKAWNGSIWTLFYEFSAYVVLGVLFSVRWIRRHGRGVSVVLLIITMALAPLMRGPLDVTTNLYLHAVELGGYFLAGTAMYFWREVVPASRSIALAAFGLVMLLMLGLPSFGTYVAQVPVAVCVLLAGALLPVRFGAVNDLSYGVYIYAFPMQQVVTLLIGASIGYVGHVVLSFIVTLPMAAASWFAVEKPSLSLKDLNLRQVVPGPGGRTGEM